MSSDADVDGPDLPRDLELSELVASATPVLRRMAPRLMGAVLRQRCRTSDLVQSALVEAIASIPSFRGKNESEFVGWTLRIMERNALDRQRRLTARKRSVEREQPEGEFGLHHLAGDGQSPSQTAIDREELLRIAKAMRYLPTDQRRVLQIVALRGGSHADAARTLGRSEGACRVLLARARAGLLVAMAKAGRGG
ncbi:MAG: sigma-70 family RNA polymerase sigma factor, partial [Planctomycetes bacterium]|nr:sigma-70 family RNA polymerase sigma factor [Planctomycetota bacterium]